MNSFVIVDHRKRIIASGVNASEVFQVIALNMVRNKIGSRRLFSDLSCYDILLCNIEGLPFEKVNTNIFTTMTTECFITSEPVELFQVIDPNVSPFGKTGSLITPLGKGTERVRISLAGLNKKGLPYRPSIVTLHSKQVKSIGLHPNFKVRRKRISLTVDQCISLLENYGTDVKVKYAFPAPTLHDLSISIPGPDTGLINQIMMDDKLREHYEKLCDTEYRE